VIHEGHRATPIKENTGKKKDNGGFCKKEKNPGLSGREYEKGESLVEGGVNKNKRHSGTR